MRLLLQHPELQPLEMALCRDDPVYWCNWWGWTYDPREEGDKDLPFDLFPRQEELWRWLRELEGARAPGLVEKSRDMGVTWICVADSVHSFLFRPGYAVGFGSRKLELVDQLGDLKAILPKARYMLERLPAFMRPNYTAGYCKIVNLDTGATITGEGGSQIGRGGRTSRYYVDEAAFLEHAEEVERSLFGNTNSRVDVSTPNGMGNPFARKRFGGRVSVFRLHWKDDPRKGDAWHEAQAAVLDPVTLAQEVDIDYTASVSGICIPAAWVRAATGLDLAWSDGTAYQVTGPTVAGWDVGERSNTLILRQGPRVLHAEQWAGDVDSATWRAVDVAERYGARTLFYDAQGPGARVAGILAGGERRTRLRIVPINGGAQVPERYILADGRRACEVYGNVRAYAWDLALGERFRKAWEFRERGTPHAPDEMIRLPEDLSQLQVELSIPLRKTTATGKTLIESKAEMTVRGVESPHYADALALTVTPAPGPLLPEFDAERHVV